MDSIELKVDWNEVELNDDADECVDECVDELREGAGWSLNDEDS